MSKYKSLGSGWFSVLFVLMPGLIFLSCNGLEKPAGAEAIAVSTEGKSHRTLPEKVVGLGKVEPEGKIIRLFPQVPGVIKTAQVKTGEQVKKGQILFEIDHDVEDAKMAVIEAQIKAGKASVRALHSNLMKARTAAANTEKSYLRLKEVFEKGAASRQDLDNVETAWKTARLDLDALQANIENGEARLEELRANLRLAQVGREKYFVKAPGEGLLLEVEGAPGASVGLTSPLCEFAPESSMSVVTEIDELFAWQVQLNQPGFIRLQGGTDTIASGRVVEISPSLRQKSLFAEEIGRLEDRRVRKVRVRLETGQDKLLYGQRVECVIDVK